MPSAKDEVSRRPSARPDPRADPDSVPRMPAVGARAGRAEKPGVREEVAPRAKKRDPRADPDSIPSMPVVRADADDVDVALSAEEPAAEAPPASGAERASAPDDPRLAEIEPLVERSAWKEIADKLGPPERAGDLPPP